MDANCESWLLSNLPEYHDVFVENEFKTLESLAILDNEDLKEMGINSVGKRKEILARTRTLKGPSSLSSVASKPSTSTAKQSLQQSLVPGENPRREPTSYQRLRQFIPNPQDEEDECYNTVLKEMYETHYGHVINDKKFREMYYKERRNRWHVKSMVQEMRNYLTFERSDNAASSKHLLNQENLSSQDQSIVKSKLAKVNQKMENVQEIINEEQRCYENCFDNNVAKKRCMQQAEWHQEAISALTSTLQELTPFRDQLTQTKQVLFSTFQGVDAAKMQHQVSRSKKENRKIAKKRKDQRMNVGVIGFLRRVTKKNLSEKCFPGGFDKHPISQYVVGKADMKDNLLPVIRPRLDQRYIEVLLKKNTFSKEVSDSLSNVQSCKKRRKMPKKVPSMTQDQESDSNIEMEENHIPESVPMSVYID